MVTRSRQFALAVLAMCLSSSCSAEPSMVLGVEDRESVTLTVYSAGLALVSDNRIGSFLGGVSKIGLTSMTSLMYAESLIVEGDGVTLREHQLEHLAGDSQDGVSTEQLLRAALNKPILVKRDGVDGRFQEATLLSLTHPALVKVGDHIDQVQHDNIVFPSDMLQDLKKVALTAQIHAASPGTKSIEITYLSGGFSWQANYVALLDEKETSIDLACTATLTNTSGSDFIGATLRLVGGDISRVNTSNKRTRGYDQFAMAAGMSMQMEEMDSVSMPSIPTGDQHIFPFRHKVDIHNDATKQLMLESCSSKDVPVKKEYRFSGLIQPYGNSEEVGPMGASMHLMLKNEAAAGLGVPLPSGVVRVYQPGPDNGPKVFLGEDQLTQTPAGSLAEIYLGKSFDVTGTAKLVTFDRSKEAYEVSQEITLLNARSDSVEIQVIGDLPRGWTMLEESQASTLKSANRISWTVEVPPRSSKQLTYRMRVREPRYRT